jgi:hypothetical protein
MATTLDEYATQLKCERCKYSPAQFSCQQCLPMNTFCSKCDSSVHSLSSKKIHKRSPLEPLNSSQYLKSIKPSNTMNIIDNNNNYSSQGFSYDNRKTNYETISPNRGEENSKLLSQSQSADIQGKIYFTNLNPNKNNVIQSMSPENFSPNNLNNFSSASYLNSNNMNLVDSSFNKKPFLSSYTTKAFSREYVNELKSIHEKEKQELLFKNNSLQQNLDRLKLSFTDQIQHLQRQVEDNNNKNNSTIRLIDEENNLKLRTIINEKDVLLQDLRKQLEEYRNCNEDLMGRLEERIKNNKINKSKTKEQVVKLETIINSKDNEIERLKSNYKGKLEDLTKKNDDQLDDYNNKFELSMNRMSLDHAKEKNKLEQLIENREKELTEVIEKKREDEKYFNQTINEIKGENEMLRKNLMKGMIRI